MIRPCTGYPVHNNQTRTGSLFVRPRWKNRINKSIKTIVKPKPESSEAAPLKLDYKSVVTTVTLNPRCKIVLFVVSTAVWWSDFTTLKENPKADLSNGFYCGKFIFSAQLMKFNHFFFVSVRPYQRIKDGPKTLPHTSSVRRIISRWMLS